MKKRYHAPRIDACRLVKVPLDVGDEAPGEAPDVVATGLAAAEIVDLVDAALLLRESDLLERALRELRTSPNPPRTVTGLARRLGVGRTTLWREWRRVFSDRVSLHLLLHAEILSRIHAVVSSGITSSEALKAWNLNRRWYTRAARLVSRVKLEP